ncbi:MAG: ATP-binding protein [Actinomycetota bacterium]|nr:ATP-binding protein [Actinomycetota bacterium]
MGQDGAASVEGTTWRLELSVPPDLSALADVRRSFDALGLPPHVRDDARLLVTELVSNSIRHAALRADERIRIWATWSGRRLKVIVRDHDDGRPVRIAGSIRPVPGAESGWGLFIVNQLASRWGAIHDGGAGYWFELDASSPQRRDQT